MPDPMRNLRIDIQKNGPLWAVFSWGVPPPLAVNVLSRL